jgi:hypothetical protein
MKNKINSIYIVKMSYVVTCNKEDEDNVFVGGFSDPASYSNNFRSPFIIEPNSEIAVESVKIDRSNEFTIKQNSRVYVYWGPEITNTSGSKTGDSPKTGVLVKVPRGSYSLEQFKVALKNAINTAPISPDIWGNCDIELTLDATTNKFDNFKFVFNMRSPANDQQSEWFAPGVLNAGNGETVKQVAEGNDPFSIDFTGVITCNVDNVRDTKIARTPLLTLSTVVQVNTYPLSQNRGLFTTQWDNATTVGAQSWIIGLKRPTSPYVDFGFPRDYFPGIDVVGDVPYNRKVRNHLTFCDFWVQYDHVEGELRVYTWGYGAGGGVSKDAWYIKEIDYWNATGSAFSAVIDDAKLNASRLEEIQFELDGNELNLQISEQGGVNPQPIVNPSSLDAQRRHNFAPLWNGTEALFPVFGMSADTQTLSVVHYTADVLSGWEHSTPSTTSLTPGSTSTRYYPDGTASLLAGSDWYSNSVQRNAFQELYTNNRRPCLEYSADSADEYVYTKTATGYSQYVPALVVGEEVYDGNGDDIYDQTLHVIPVPRNPATIGPTIGFDRFSVADYATFGSASGASTKILTSVDSGNLITHSAFVRVNDLTIQSFNGAQQGRSNILYHIPRFTNEGRQFGELFFQSAEKTYVKINNTSKMTLNQLSVDIVGRNEKVVTDLQGSTIVVFHIRKSKD